MLNDEKREWGGDFSEIPEEPKEGVRKEIENARDSAFAYVDSGDFSELESFINDFVSSLSFLKEVDREAITSSLEDAIKETQEALDDVGGDPEKEQEIKSELTGSITGIFEQLLEEAAAKK